MDPEFETNPNIAVSAGTTPPEEKTSGYSVTSMILGIVSLLCVGSCLPAGVLAILFAVIGRGRDGKWKGMAVAGLVCGIISLLLTLLLILLSRDITIPEELKPFFELPESEAVFRALF